MTGGPSEDDGSSWASGPDLAGSAWQGLHATACARVTEIGVAVVLVIAAAGVIAGSGGARWAFTVEGVSSVVAIVLAFAAFAWSMRVQRRLFPGWRYWQLRRRAADIRSGVDVGVLGALPAGERSARVACWRVSVAIRLAWLMALLTMSTVGSLFDSGVAHPFQHWVLLLAALCGVGAGVAGVLDVRRWRRSAARRS